MLTAALFAGTCGAMAAAPEETGGDVPPPMLGKGNPFTIADLPEGDFRSRLESLSPAARERALEWLHRIEFPLNDLESLRVDDEGGVFYADSPPLPPAE
jgi:hypothetical protein